MKTFIVFNVNFQKQAAQILSNLCDAEINLDYSAGEELNINLILQVYLRKL